MTTSQMSYSASMYDGMREKTGQRGKEGECWEGVVRGEEGWEREEGEEGEEGKEGGEIRVR